MVTEESWLERQARRAIELLLSIPEEQRTPIQKDLIEGYLARKRRIRRDELGLRVINGGRADLAPPSHDRWAKGMLELIRGGLNG